MTQVLYPVAPRTDLRGAFAWIAVGAIIVFASWRMDRFEQQGAQFYSAPGLWPGVIGLLIALLGGFLAWRSVRRARAASWDAAEHDDTVLAPTSHFVLASAMFFAYALLLVGHGLPFWLGTSLFVAVYVYLFRRFARMSGERTGSNRGDLVLAVITGVATAGIVSVVFQELFYVNLP